MSSVWFVLLPYQKIKLPIKIWYICKSYDANKIENQICLMYSPRETCITQNEHRLLPKVF